MMAAARRLPTTTALLAGLVAVLVGGAIGIGVRGRNSDEAATTVVTTAPAVNPGIPVGDLRVALSDDWQRDATPLRVPGLDGPRSLGLTSTQGSAVLAQVDPAGPSLLPAALEQALGGAKGDQVASGTPVSVGGLNLLHYTVTLPNLLGVYAMPTTKGVAVLACTGDVATCPDLLAGVTVPGGRILGLGQDPAMHAGLVALVPRLAAQRRQYRSGLAQATTPAARAAAASALADAYTAAGNTLLPLRTQSADSVATPRLLWRLAREYRDLAAAATGQDGAAFAQAGARISADEQQLDDLLARWQAKR